MSLISVEEALARVLASIERPVEAEQIAIADAVGRTLAEPLAALRDQPPFPASAMDGYAVRVDDAARVPATLAVIGTSAAGHGFGGVVGPGETVRILTGAPVPEGADGIVIQEDARREGERVLVTEAPVRGRFIRPSGLDFRTGDGLLEAGERLDARCLALAAAMGHGNLPVRRRPRVAVLATGDELVAPGTARAADQIVASNPYAIAALVGRAGGEAVDLGIAADTFEALAERIGAARSAGADLLVTLGGASVGEHDLVQSALTRQGMRLGFWRVALRPGKPLMHGRLGPMALLGLPGNPVSSIVCGILFLVPAVRALLGDPRAADDPTEPALLGGDCAANDNRQDYLRATLAPVGAGLPVATPHRVQDSSMLGVLSRSQALIVRAPGAPAAKAGEGCRIVRLDRFC
jgi:molybdopterin molybdotransferase